MAKDVTGPVAGLKAEQRHALQRVYRRTVAPSQVVTWELASFLAELSATLRRQLGVLLDRRGRVQHVIVGEGRRLVLPDLGRHRAGRGRLRGLRLVHTHVFGGPLDRDDLTDLSLLQLDLVAVIQVDPAGHATTIELAHLVPPRLDGALWEVEAPVPLQALDFDFQLFIQDLEVQLASSSRAVEVDGRTRAVAVHVSKDAPGSTAVATSLAELRELAATAGVEVVEEVVQRRPRPDPRYVMGRGRLQDLLLASMQQGVDLIVFDQDLTPGQARSIAEVTELRVIDRTQLILDIFAQRARSRDGKLQVELAQLAYTLPRLAGSSQAMSRLAGGIGGRGPGETKLEINRRRAKDRITRLRKQIKLLGRQRRERRRRRQRSGLPVVSVVGYTNAGKSTLLNALTGSEVLAEDKLFATLDPTSRRLRFPDEREVVLTDTVGFIRDLPEDLVAAFKATLEELDEADVLLHVVDLAQPGFDERMAAVERILGELDLGDKPRLLVFNKVDRVTEPPEVVDTLCRVHDALALSALDRASFGPLVERLLELVERRDRRRQAERG